MEPESMSVAVSVVTGALNVTARLVDRGCVVPSFEISISMGTGNAYV